MHLEGLAVLRDAFADVVAGDERVIFEKRVAEIRELGADESFSKRLITLRFLDQLLEIDTAGLRVRKHGEFALDLCGIAKGHGADELGRVLNEHGLGAWIVGIDGELRMQGHRPDGSGWAVALERPQEGARQAMGVIELNDASIATSGDYRHVTWVAGQRITHTMDPRTGAPVSNTLAAVTVVCERCVDADAYATALMVLGEPAGLALARQLGLDALFVTRTPQGLATSGTGSFAHDVCSD